MVIVGGRPVEERKEEEASFAMAMSTERSRSLHNFSLPCLKWGGQRHLRCVKVDGDGGGRGPERRSPPPTSFDFGRLTRKASESERKRRSLLESGDGIEAVRKKLMLDLQTEMDKMKFAVMREGENDGIEPPPPPSPTRKTEDSPADEARPWNLRTRRSACKEPSASGWKSQRFDEGFSPARDSMKPPASRNPNSGIKRPRAKFSVPLSKQEIEEDFIAMMGTRPPRKPKKRPRHVQKQMDTQFPGLWLSEITADMYKVNENPEAGKK